MQGAVLVITEDMMAKSHTFQCTASNRYNEKHHTATVNITYTIPGIYTMLIVILVH